MRCSGVIMTWVVVWSRLLLVKIHGKPIEHDLDHRSASPSIWRRTSLLEPQVSSGSGSGGAASTSYSNNAVSASNNDFLKVMDAVVPTSLATNQPVSTKLTCDTSQPKLAINQLLVSNHEKMRELSGSIEALIAQVDKDNSQSIGGLIASKLEQTITTLTTCLRSIQVCGIDPKPLSANRGINLSDVSWSAFQLVLTLKTVFESISNLYKPFPAIQSTCSDVLVKLSTALASLIGACGEQLNLFDTRFFPLVTPQLKELTEIPDNFSAFFGSFIA